MLLSSNLRKRLAVLAKQHGIEISVKLNEFSDSLRSSTLWTRSYFVSTAGNVSRETIRRYVEEQKIR